MLRRFKVDYFTDGDRGGALYPLEFPTLGHEVKRLFWVTCGSGSKRGAHAHKSCIQTLICVSGNILLSVSASDGIGADITMIAGDAITIEPGVWAEQTYLGNGMDGKTSTLLVLCSEGYDPEDYVE